MNNLNTDLWTIVKIGTFRVEPFWEDHPDNKLAAVWLDGWHFAHDDGHQAITHFSEDGSPNLIIPNEKWQGYMLFGHLLYELAQLYLREHAGT